MKVLVTGGRGYNNVAHLNFILDKLHGKFGFSLLITGGATGADYWANRWAKDRGIQPVSCEALWDFYNNQGRRKAAGGIRNSNMLLLEPDLVIAFPGHTGTQDMTSKALNRAREGAKIKVIQVTEDPQQPLRVL